MTSQQWVVKRKHHKKIKPRRLLPKKRRRDTMQKQDSVAQVLIEELDDSDHPDSGDEEFTAQQL